jgi:pimeloyl-ACP methyl ester carboxylesterase
VLHDGISGSQLVVLEGARHLSMVDAQRGYLSAVRDFLRGIESGKTADILRRS